MAGRPTKETQADRRLERAFGEIKNSVDEEARGKDRSDRLTVREIKFAWLIASEGYTQSDAYIESHEPQNASEKSIHQMASRMAARTRIKAEIERIQRSLRDDELKRDERLAVALHGQKARDRIALELYIIATSGSVSPKDRTRALVEWGKMKHVDAFTSAGSTVNVSSTSNTLVLPPDTTLDQAKKLVMERIRGFLPAPKEANVIDVSSESYESESQPKQQS